jgi:hypothetical protein
MTQAILVALKNETLIGPEPNAGLAALKKEVIYTWDTPTMTLVSLKKEVGYAYLTPTQSLSSLKMEVLLSNAQPPRKRQFVNLN